MRRALFVSLLALAACGKLEPQTGAVGEPCSRNADCASGLACNDGVCVADRFRTCDAGTKRCNGGALEVCKATADGWSVTKCPGGCEAGACLKPPCAQGDRKCDGKLLYQCLDDGSAWQFVDACPAGCDSSGLECAKPACAPFETRCKAGAIDQLQTCDAHGGGWLESACVIAGVEAVCDGGRCLPKVCPASGARESHCDGDVRTVCNQLGSAFDPQELCAWGCEETSPVAATCRAAACATGEEKCEGDALLRCTPDRREFAFVQFCPAGCTAAAGKGTCTTPLCSPLARRCARDTDNGWIVQGCNAAGTRYDTAERCPEGCSNGTCVTENAGCIDGERRCSGREAELCVRLASGSTQWRLEERCVGFCQGGACDGAGACGCAGGASASGDSCGSGARLAVRLEVFGSEAGSFAADATSTFLVHTSPIASSTGHLVPDGTLVTFSADGTDAPFVSPDADPATPGLQRPTEAGRARVVLKAPSAARDVTVTGGLGGRCSSPLVLRFVAPGAGAKQVYVAEDFSTSRVLDRIATTAQWDVGAGRVRADAIFELGTGADGAYTVSSGTKDLWDDGFARAFNVTALAATEATVDSFVTALAPGDELLLMHLAGAASLVGTYEFRRLIAVDGARLRFDAPVRNTYGPTSNADLSGQRVVLQRVPQFTDLTVAPGAILTTKAYQATSGGTGVLALRARGTVRIGGTIALGERGLPSGTAQAGTTNALLSRLLLGGGAGSKAGGGVVFIAARTLSLRPEPTQAASGTIVASSSAGQGGTIWLQAGSIGLGTNLVVATGAAAAQNGRVRLDYGVAEASQTTPDAAIGQGGGLLVQTLASYVEAAGPALVRSATLLGVVAGAGTLTAGLPSQIPGIGIDASADAGGAPAYVNASSGKATFPNGNKQFRWRGRLDTLGDEPVDLAGVAFRLEVN